MPYLSDSLNFLSKLTPRRLLNVSKILASYYYTRDELAQNLLYLIFYFQGEPYINPKFLDMVKYAHDKGIYTITSTNGHFLNKANAKKTIESGLDRMIISVDGTTQETYTADTRIKATVATK